MTYFNLNFVTNPPNDELVNEETQINDNWEEIDAKLGPFNKQPATIVGSASVPLGTEALYPISVGGVNSHRIAVWDGTDWKITVSEATGWLGWTSLSLRSPRSIALACKYNVNVLRRQVILTGAVRFDGVGGAWPTASDTEITADTAIPTTYLPVGGNNICQLSTDNGITTAGQLACAVASVHQASTPTRLAITVKWQGAATSLNWVYLDNMMWWY
ncbi:hypothetical protein ACFY7C_36810 [Streptomyces sp. NPDC012769]|uniref:hypothetical protein n=1 Tax=Streptomyces sp. NPDC012769 TaxID=3364848 RepID=UPI00367BF4D2